MQVAFRYLAPPSACGYLPDQVWRLEYEQVAALSAIEYEERLQEGWRRFGHALFRPRCPVCSACWPIRVQVDAFEPNRSQRRVRKLNQGALELRIGQPEVTPEKLELYDRFHAFQSGHKGWPEQEPQSPLDYLGSFALNPVPTQEWCYYRGGKLKGVGYVDVLPESLSAVYFFYDPDDRPRSPGTWNVLCIIDQARVFGLKHVYLGYYVSGCRSMAYKSCFRPNEVLGPNGAWRHFLPAKP